MNFITILYRMFIILRCGSKILYEMLNDNWLVSFWFFSRIYLPISFRNVNFLDKMFPGDPLLQGFFSLSKRFTNPSLPHRGSAEPHPHLSLPRDKVVLGEEPSARMFFRAQDAPGPCYIAPFCKKKKAHERALLWASWYRSCHFRNKV